MRIYVTIFLLTAIFSAEQVFCQSTYLGNYVQPAPNAASLGKFADYPVSYYTGVPNIQIPIYELKDGDLSVPISLSYHASGIRVSEVASWVGLGWALNAGGILIRTVRGAPDEGALNSAFASGPVGYYKDSGLRKLPLIPYPVNGAISAVINSSQTFSNSVPGIQGGALDCEPDLFTFNFNGYLGKFVFDENRQPRLLEDDNIKIDVAYDGSFKYWCFTTADGIKYFFGENNTSEKTVPHSTVSGDDNNAQRPSSWFLTKILNPNTKDTVTLSYSPEVYSYRDLGPESSVYTYNTVQTACNNDDIVVNLLNTTVTGWRLSSIQSSNYLVSFIAKTTRTDLTSSGTTSANTLDSVKIFTKSGVCIKQYAFSYSYFTSSATSTTSAVSNLLSQQYNNDITDTKRLKLLAVTEYSGDGSLQKPSYNLTYQESYTLPRRLSYDQDHWGYCNNTTGSKNPYFTPNLYQPICSFTDPTKDTKRDSKWPDMSAYALTDVEDPLGVKTSFVFEANTAFNANPSIVGGLRIKQINTKDNITGKTQSRTYNYGDGGALSRLPKYMINLQNEYYFQRGAAVSTSYIGYGTLAYITDILKQSSSIIPLQDAQGNHIGYPNVKETFGMSGEGGFKTYRYQIDQLPSGSSRLSIANYTAFTYIKDLYGNSISGIYGNGHFNDILPENLQYYTNYDVERLYPFAPQQVDLRRGKLIEECVYDSLGTLLTKKENNYSTIYHENYLIRGLKTFRTVGPPSVPTGSSVTNDAYTYYKLHTGIARLSSTISTVFKDNSQSSDTVRYGYESAFHTLKTIDTSYNSLRDTIISKDIYSFDYTDNASGDNAFAKMRARNLLLPVSKLTWKNGKLLKGTVTKFSDFSSASADTFINPQKVYSLDISSPLTPAQANQSIALVGQLNTLIPNTYYKEKATFNYQSTTGKIIEQNLINDQVESIIWDQQTDLPLAVAKNTNLANIAYSGFESGEMGNWLYTPASVAADNTAPAGTKAYILSSGNSITKPGLINSKGYIVSYWKKTGASVTIAGGTQSNQVIGNTVNGWTLNQVTINMSGSSLTISGNGSIDNITLFPSDAEVTTYTYDTQFRLTSQSTSNGTISRYEYDGLNRLLDIKDYKGNIIKAFDYNYGRLSR